MADSLSHDETIGQGKGVGVAWGALVVVVIGAMLFFAYRELLTRPFAADDYQWLLNVRGLDVQQVIRRAFDVGAQTHFFRPLVWLLFWLQVRWFGVEPFGFHIVTLGLHGLNVWLAAGLARRFGADQRGWALTAAIVALHPAPFEAITWISAQSELLAASLLLLTLHVWLFGDVRVSGGVRGLRLVGWVGASFGLALALLTKESAIIGLPCLVVFGAGGGFDGARSLRLYAARVVPYVLPTLLTLGYAVLQVTIEQRNYLVHDGGYGIGLQLLVNPLRSLALLVAPFPGTEHADVGWLVPLGVVVALGLAVLFVGGTWRIRRLILVLLLTLLPTAPFVTAPNSRYLYAPVLAMALLVGVFDRRCWSFGVGAAASGPTAAFFARWWLSVVRWLVVLVVVWAAPAELRVREGRFAAGSGSGGSLWRLATGVCATEVPSQVLIVEPPLAPQHVEAIIDLACGTDAQFQIVGADQVAGAVVPGSIVVAFVGGSARIESRH